MADWTTLPNTAVGVGGLPSGTTVTALRDNPVAIAEGAAGAPRVWGSAIRANLLADASLTSPGSSLVINNIPSHFAVYIQLDATPSGSTLIDCNVSNDNGATWAPRIFFINSSTPFSRSGFLYSNGINANALGFGDVGNITFQGPVNAVRCFANPSGTITSARIRVFGIMREWE